MKLSWFFPLIFALCLVPVLMHGCAPVQMTASQARGWCMSYKGTLEDSCLESNKVCDTYGDTMALTYADREECRKACYATRSKMNGDVAYIGCTYLAGKGKNSCLSYCSSQYDQ